MNRRQFLKQVTTTSLALILPNSILSKVRISKELKMNAVLHKANTRGVADHGWLNSHHTFSFASYYDPKRMGFGALRVINDDIVAPSRGFGTHPHDNMEIISVPLKGALKHKDTMGNEHVIKKGEIQAMSAGTGLYHSEYNDSPEEDVNFLQIWVLPKKKNIKPNYSQKEFNESARENNFQLIVSPDGRDNTVEVNQDAFFTLVKLDGKKELQYSKYQKENGVYFFVLDGNLKINGEALAKRDGLGVENVDDFKMATNSNSEILIMEVPMLKERMA